MIHEPSDHQPDLDPQGLWQSQKKEYDPMTLAAIHDKARAFDKRIQARNAREYVACGVVIVGFAPAFFLPVHWLMKAGAAWIILSVFFVAWQLHRRASNEALPAPGETLVDAYRRQLTRQRDAARTVWSWYLGPMAPGMVLLCVGMWLGPPRLGVPIERAHASILITAVLVVVVWVGVWWLNQRGAKRLQKRIDEL
jgi:hypothetical protein